MSVTDSQIMSYLEGKDTEAFVEFLQTTSDAHKIIRDVIKRKYKPPAKYFYLITLTIDPKKHETITQELEDKIEKYILNQTKRKDPKYLQFAYVRELHKNGRPHWHIGAETEKYLAKSRFSHYASNYGFVDISKSRTDNYDKILQYINKQFPAKVII